MDSRINEALSLETGEAGAFHLNWQGEDWLGALRFGFGAEELGVSLEEALGGADDWGAYLSWSARPDEPCAADLTIRVYQNRPLVIFSLEASKDIEFGKAVGLDHMRAAWPFADPRERDGGLVASLSATGFQLVEFGLPLISRGDYSDFEFFPDRPHACAPLMISHDDGRCLVLGAVNQFHDQWIGLPSANEGRIACGWHGDLARVPKGFRTEFAIFGGVGLRSTLEAFGRELQARYGTQRPSRYADVGVGKLSYWTDNGAAYWYRSEDGEPIHDTLVRVKNSLKQSGVPVAAWQLDSWFYNHEKPRPLNPGGDDIVPPSGMMNWETRPDMLPHGVSGVAEALENPPLILHSRHFSSKSPYFKEFEAWEDGEYAHPKKRGLIDKLMAQAQNWGAITYEQDWLSEAFLFVRGLREEPGRADRWLEGLDQSAEDHGLTLQWCMATPQTFFHTLKLRNVTSIRTCNDYRYKAGAHFHWCWFLYVNTLARALGLYPYKDVFFSLPEGQGINGDPNAEIEALLATLSAGPVGIGDRVGRTDKDIVMRSCRSDGLLLKPDVPIAPVDGVFDGVHRVKSDKPMIADCYTDHKAGRWHYVLAANASEARTPMNAALSLEEWGADYIAYDWREQAWTAPGAAPPAKHLAGKEWAYWVLVPMAKSGIALLGDPDKYACAADRRLGKVKEIEGGLSVEVLGAPGEEVTLRAWAHSKCEASGPVDVAMTPGGAGSFDMALRLPDCGAVRLELVVVKS